MTGQASDMDVRILFMFAVFTQWKFIYSVSISGEISEDVTFVHKMFPVPSMRAIIEVDFSFPVASFGRYKPTMEIYTTQDHVNLRKRCTYVRYGQLRNPNVHIPVRLDNNGTPRCLEQNDGKVHCIGNVTVQEFKPKNFSFSIGFDCHSISRITSLKGVVYNIRIHGQTNETNCVRLPLKTMKFCSQFYQHGILPNFIGQENMKEVKTLYDKAKGYATAAIVTGLCYPHTLELSCHLLIPECDPVSSQVIHPCKEMCQDIRKACSKIKLPESIPVDERLPGIFSEDNKLVEFIDTTSFHFDCDYLPSLGGDVPCFYKAITCKSPPLVKNAALYNNSNKSNTYSVLDTVDYSCNDGFEIKGSKNISCMFSGEWSTPPQCSLASASRVHPFIVVVLTLTFPIVVIITTVLVKNRMKLQKQTKPALPTKQVEFDDILLSMQTTDMSPVPLKRKLDTKRNSFFDAFVLYHFDSNNNFVVNHLIPELEEMRRFRLCIHSRNFIPGRDIKENIEDAIEDSNSAIIVMSQGFVDSMWCKEEFTHCYIENMKDAAFSLFVIMMQPADILVNTSPYMRTFFKTKTYLERNDPKLFTKLGTYLMNSREIEHDDVDESVDRDDDDADHDHDIEHNTRFLFSSGDNDDDDEGDVEKHEETLVVKETLA